MTMGIKIGKVMEILQDNENRTELLIGLQEKKFKAVNYNKLTGKVKVGDTVLLNTTAVELSLGTGGYHFVISNLDNPSQDVTGEGHIMKLRYTPYQLKVFSAEEQESPYHQIFNSFTSLHGLPIIIGGLHSMLYPVVKVLKGLRSSIRIAYIMTDGAALPIEFSNTVRDLKEEGELVGTITIGNAFGGDLECVNIYNGIIGAKEILKCDLAMVSMGPGIVGTGTKFGYSGIEQGHIIDAVNDLGGTPIAIPRISFADMRPRHFGISHHTMTVLSTICKSEATLGVPMYNHESKTNHVLQQLKESAIDKKHKCITIDRAQVMAITEILEKFKPKMSTMGRKYEDDQEFFITAGAAGQLAINLLADLQ